MILKFFEITDVHRKGNDPISRWFPNRKEVLPEGSHCHRGRIILLNNPPTPLQSNEYLFTKEVMRLLTTRVPIGSCNTALLLFTIIFITVIFII